MKDRGDQISEYFPWILSSLMNVINGGNVGGNDGTFSNQPADHASRSTLLGHVLSLVKKNGYNLV